MTDYVRKNVAAVKQEIATAEHEAGREGKTSLIAAVKYATNEEIKELISLGVCDVGENRVQQLLEHLPAYEGKPVRLHFIGTLQKNKIKYIIDKVYAIHSVDGLSLAGELNRHAAKHGCKPRVFVEVNIGREPTKGGVMPEDAEALCKDIEGMPNLLLSGLMTMAPPSESEAEYRTYFAQTRDLANGIWQALGRTDKPQLSMGMSGSFGAAIKEGADMVRIGRRLFAREN